MYLKMVWCYVFILALLDISLNTKLTAQGKSHESVHDQWMLIEKVHFQEYGKDEVMVPESSIRVWPPALEFGRVELARPAALVVALTNTGNETMHLTSVAGSTSHFHSSFFETKTLPPQANTSFTVVFLGQREGFVSAHLFIHTSLGVHKYPVSAEGVPNEFDVWPMVGVRVPLNATLEPLLTMRNPTDHTIQVTEIYSSSSWLGLQLPDGASSAPLALWRLPPHSAAPLVRLRLAAASAAPQRAYIRIKANITGGGLVVAVEARMTSPQEFLEPLQLRLRLRGSKDAQETVEISAGSSAPSAAEGAARVWGARCAGAPFPPRHPLREPARHANGALDAAHGVKSEGVQVTLLRPQIDAFQPLTPSVRLTLDFGRMWESYISSEPAEANGSGAQTEWAWCAGFVRVGRAAMPYSVRLRRGGLALLPAALLFITADADVMKVREVQVKNDFKMAVRLLGLDYEPELREWFHIEELPGARGSLRGGETRTVARLSLKRAPDEHAQLSSALRVRSSLAAHSLPVSVAPGRFVLEWEWPNSADGTLRLGTTGTSSTRRAALVLRNPGPHALCLRALHVDLPGGSLLPHDHTHNHNHNHTRCLESGARARWWLVVVAPARGGELAGRVTARSQHAAATARVTLRARAGHVRHALPLRLQGAPYVAGSAPLELVSSMALRMRATHVTPPGCGLSVQLDKDVDITEGRHTVGTVTYSAEAGCAPDCYAGLDMHSQEGIDWISRLRILSDRESPEADKSAALKQDGELIARRLQAFARARRAEHNTTIYLHTTEVVQIPISVSARATWPRLRVRGGGGALCGVGGAERLRVLLRNPAARDVLLWPALPHLELAGPQLEGWEEKRQCPECTWQPDTFSFIEYQVVKGNVRVWEAGERDERPARNRSWLPALLLSPGAEIELVLNFTPKVAAPLSAKVYLRNNLTIIESVQVWGHGVYPSFELEGLRPGKVFEITECDESGLGIAHATVVARNTGRVPVVLRDWRVSGSACGARGFLLEPCAALELPRNHSRPLRLAFRADWTRARVSAALQVRSALGAAEFPLRARVAARLAAACAARLPRPPWERALHAAGAAAALAALLLALAAAALDAERALRRTTTAVAQQPPPSHSPLDLRGVAAACRTESPPRAPAPRRKRPRRAPPLDPAAERHAFQRWRAEVLRRAESHSSEDADASQDAETDSTPPPMAPRGEPGAHAADTGSESSSPGEERDEHDEPLPAAGAADGAGAAGGPPAQAHPARASPPRAPPAPRRAERPRADDARARGPPRHHARKEKSSRRRFPAERAAPASPSPAAGAPSAPRAPAALRRGATWSSVVADGPPAPAPPPLAPIGSDVRRRADAAGAHSLFYYNEAAPHAWRLTDYTEDGTSSPRGAPSLGYGSVWGGADPAWLWGADPVRPPPGFAPPAAPRAYDPFRSLAAIWGPGALDWRRDPDDPPPGN